MVAWEHSPAQVQVHALDAARHCCWALLTAPSLCPPSPLCAPNRYSLLSEMPPWMGGGEMIQEVRLEASTYADPPSRFEAGTPAIAEAIGLGAACDYLSGLGMQRVAAHERELGAHLYERVRVRGLGWVGVWVGGGDVDGTGFGTAAERLYSSVLQPAVSYQSELMLAHTALHLPSKTFTPVAVHQRRAHLRAHARQPAGAGRAGHLQRGGHPPHRHLHHPGQRALCEQMGGW